MPASALDAPARHPSSSPQQGPLRSIRRHSSGGCARHPIERSLPRRGFRIAGMAGAPRLAAGRCRVWHRGFPAMHPPMPVRSSIHRAARTARPPMANKALHPMTAPRGRPVIRESVEGQSWVSLVGRAIRSHDFRSGLPGSQQRLVLARLLPCESPEDVHAPLRCYRVENIAWKPYQGVAANCVRRDFRRLILIWIIHFDSRSRWTQCSAETAERVSWRVLCH